MQTYDFRWKMRDPYFNGPGKYSLQLSDGLLEFDVDELRYFHTHRPISNFPLQVLAEPIG